MIANFRPGCPSSVCEIPYSSDSQQNYHAASGLKRAVQGPYSSAQRRDLCYQQAILETKLYGKPRDHNNETKESEYGDNIFSPFFCCVVASDRLFCRFISSRFSYLIAPSLLSLYRKTPAADSQNQFLTF